jgi:hypothetical protein
MGGAAREGVRQRDRKRIRTLRAATAGHADRL